MPLDHRRYRGAVVKANEGTPHLIGCANGPQVLESGGLIAPRRQDTGWRGSIEDRVGDDIGQEGIKVAVAEESKHPLLLDAAGPMSTAA